MLSSSLGNQLLHGLGCFASRSDKVETAGLRLGGSMSHADLFFFFLVFSRAAPVAYGGSQARGLIGALATGPCQSRSNSGSELHLRPTPQLTTMPDP